MNDNNNILIIIILVGVLILFLWLHHKLKHPKISNLCVVTGGVKTGKSTFAVALAVKKWRSQVRFTKVQNFFIKVFTKKKEKDLPLLYSNIPLSIPYSPITPELLQRKERFVYGSVILCDEASLVADSQLIKDGDLNQELLLFNKLIGHETRGGYLIYDTQSIGDCHYSIKRCLSEYFYIHHLIKLPFFVIAAVREDRYSDDGSIIATSNEDVEETLKYVLISKKYWKYFDCYCFSPLTDNLKVANKVEHRKKGDLKSNKIVSFRNGGYLTTSKNDEKMKEFK